MNYRRTRIPGGIYFFTIVTYQRKAILCQREEVDLLREAFREVKKKHPFSMEAIVVLPDHMHCLMKLPDGESDYPLRIRLIKSHFSRRFRENDVENTSSRIQKGERPIWQRRYWEHAIRDDEDYRRHVEYIHYNPVKHGVADAPKEWPYSSFHHYVRRGVYEIDWGAGGELCFDDAVGGNEICWVTLR